MAGGQHPLQQLVHAVAHHPADLVGAQRTRAEIRQEVVGGRLEVPQGVHHGAIEIEQQNPGIAQSLLFVSHHCSH